MARGDVEYGIGGYMAPPPPLRRPWFPWLVPSIFVGTIALFVYSLYVNNCPEVTGAYRCVFYPSLGRFSFQPLTENPLLGPSTATLKKLGALNLKLVQDGEKWRLLACVFLHAGVIHLLANMLTLLFIGIRMEREFGFLRIGVLYVLSGVGGSIASCFYNADSKSLSVGASGALFGLLGAMLSELITNWTIYAKKCAALVSLVLVICVSMAIGFLPHVDGSSHSGGFASGFLLGFILLVRPQFGYVSQKCVHPGYEMNKTKSKYKCYQYFLWITAFVLFIIGYVISLFILFHTKLPNN
ncbi:RHOMBOID-like protein 5 [Malania oleifera]|uniref:RHOMBOID-like protein 5 n=1 Tax=Malania oleifera TaxID=397392 RepID=UPI0025ADB0A7|nr:RHOMBOID-like protein 5 [Malania oleifera]